MNLTLLRNSNWVITIWTSYKNRPKVELHRVKNCQKKFTQSTHTRKNGRLFSFTSFLFQVYQNDNWTNLFLKLSLRYSQYVSFWFSVEIFQHHKLFFSDYEQKLTQKKLRTKQKNVVVSQVVWHFSSSKKLEFLVFIGRIRIFKHCIIHPQKSINRLSQCVWLSTFFG